MHYVAVFVTQYKSVSSFGPNFRILCPVFAEKYLTEKMSIGLTERTMEDMNKKAK